MLTLDHSCKISHAKGHHININKLVIFTSNKLLKSLMADTEPNMECRIYSKAPDVKFEIFSLVLQGPLLQSHLHPDLVIVVPTADQNIKL